MDGVITDTAEYHYLAWKSLGEELGITVTREWNESLKGISRMEALDKILELGNMELLYSMEEKIALAEKKNSFYLERIASITFEDILPGVISLLQEIRQTGLKVGLASASHNAPFILDKLGIRHYFDVIGMYSIGVGDSNILSHANDVVASLLELHLEDFI